MAKEDICDISRDDLLVTWFSNFSDMRENGEFCDVTIRVGQGCFRAHKAVLASTISYFDSVFSTQTEDGMEDEITIENTDPSALKCMIDFAYGKDLEITESNAKCLIELAFTLKFKSAIDGCLEFLEKKITSDNVFIIHEWAKSAANSSVIRSTDYFIQKNFENVSKSAEFLNVSFDLLKEIISSNDLIVSCEEVVYESVIRWVRKFQDERSVHLPELLRHIRLLHFLDPEYLNSCVVSEELVRNYPSCKTLLDEARNLHQPEPAFNPCHIVNQSFLRKKPYLKCSERNGYGLCAVFNRPLAKFVYYYDHINKFWIPLCFKHDFPEECFMFSEEEKIYFLKDSCIEVLNLRAMDLRSFKISIRNGIFKLFFDSGKIFHRNKIYFIGGQKGNSGSVRCLDLKNLSSSEVGRLANSRYAPALAPLGNNIYITGGKDNANSTPLSSAEKYNIATKLCAEISPMLIERSGHQCAVLNEKIYVCGGEAGRRFITHTSLCEVYDPASDRWTFISGVQYNISSASLVVRDRKLCIIDQPGEHEKYFRVQSYNPIDDEWKAEEVLTFLDGYGKSTFLELKIF